MEAAPTELSVCLLPPYPLTRRVGRASYLISEFGSSYDLAQLSPLVLWDLLCAQCAFSDPPHCRSAKACGFLTTACD